MINRLDSYCVLVAGDNSGGVEKGRRISDSGDLAAGKTRIGPSLLSHCCSENAAVCSHANANHHTSGGAEPVSLSKDDSWVGYWSQGGDKHVMGTLSGSAKPRKNSKYYKQVQRQRAKRRKKFNKKAQPKNVRRNRKQRNTARQTHILRNATKATQDESTLVHVLLEAELLTLKKNGATIAHVSQPKRDLLNQKICWQVVSPRSSEVTPTIGSIAIVTTYNQLKDDPKIVFVGAFPGECPAQDAWILLSLVIQQECMEVLDDNNIPELYKMCKASKTNITIAGTSSHHRSQGGIYGFGSRKETSTKKHSGSSVEQYVCFKGMEEVDKELESLVTGGIEEAQDLLTEFAGHDLISINCCQLEATEHEAIENGYGEDFHLKGETGYTSLYFNFDASTMDSHTEMDWTMTTLFVPEQNWDGKDANHLLFQFLLTDNESDNISIAMKPGTVVYFHGYLVTHHQMHDQGECTETGCCLNYSAYANKKLRCHVIKTNNRAQQITQRRKLGMKK